MMTLALSVRPVSRRLASLAAALVLVLAACSTEAPPEDHRGSLGKADSFDINPNRLLEDEDLSGGRSITTADVQAFLEQMGSYLAYHYENDGRSAAQVIVDNGRAYHISPLYLIARIETESSLITSGSSHKLWQATGCDCPDGGVACNPAVAGFNLQIRCAANLMRQYLTRLEAGGYTIAGWKAGVGMNTSDGCWVVPENNATAALYTYTPWVGAWASGWCGTSEWGGSSLVALNVARFRAAYPWPGRGWGGGSSCESLTVGSPVPQGGCVRASSDSAWYQCSDGNMVASEGGSWGPVGECTVSYPFCVSESLGRELPARTCVLSDSDGAWYQCSAQGKWQPAWNGAGPLGACSEEIQP